MKEGKKYVERKTQLEIYFDNPKEWPDFQLKSCISIYDQITRYCNVISPNQEIRHNSIIMPLEELSGDMKKSKYQEIVEEGKSMV